MPSYSFVSTINEFVLRGVRPVFIDIHPDTINMTESQLGKLITARTKNKTQIKRMTIPWLKTLKS